MKRYKLENMTLVKFHVVHRSGGKSSDRKRRPKTVPIYYGRREAWECNDHADVCRCEVCRFWGN